MDNIKCFKEIRLMCVIINSGLASKVVKHAKKSGVTGATVLLGTGTIKSSVLEFLGINESRKEVVLMAADKETTKITLESLNKKFQFYKANHGVAFSTPIKNIIGSKSIKCDDIKRRGEKMAEYNVIFTIVDRGNGSRVIDSANSAGSRGATILHGRGSGIHETSKVFGMEIEPEKEVIMMISPSELTEAIVSSINKELNVDEPGNGIIFVQDIDSTYGLY